MSELAFSGIRKYAATIAVVAVITAGALAFRIPRLEQRPMHTDEAVHAIKAGILIEQGVYTYDPTEYHGPTIYYFALPFVWLAGATSLADTTEFTFRIVPVLFGTALVLLTLLIADGLGRRAVIMAAVLAAVSPAMVFYSRYYIQEMLLVVFAFGVLACLWRYSQSRHIRWALAAGMCAGLMHATKETCVINYFAFGAAILCGFAWARLVDGYHLPFRRVFLHEHLLAAGIVLFFVSAPLLTSFFVNPRATVDAWLTYLNYFQRAGGVGIHDHPWHYYLLMLIRDHETGGPLWTEGLIVGLALVGALFAMRPHRREVDSNSQARPIALVRVLTFYTAILVVIYSAIPYKTPWCMLTFLHGMILLAGYGAVNLICLVPTRVAKGIVLVALGAGIYQLGCQAYRASFTYYADTRNPYVYGHTSTNLLKLTSRVEDIVRISPEGKDMLIRVIAPDPWPLPWYFRGYSQVGYWPDPPDDTDAPVVITTPDLKEQVDARQKEAYESSTFGQRPTVFMVAEIRKDLWDTFMETRQNVRRPAAGGR